ncbi:hypothetical protein EQG49_02465 [Periweissella cryptocerci]|uniref:Tail assembly chaperone n=1 Tax=Periweissella cryptocerci TaxID=2506420 RepID=A0A4P6YS00_9LACO|nr:hypothetical protein [Periweissella cryptocerci]QBO35406.1 hypothetical protein EQG49_02465 [Periweissella cryptocerci]
MTKNKQSTFKFKIQQDENEYFGDPKITTNMDIPAQIFAVAKMPLDLMQKFDEEKMSSDEIDKALKLMIEALEETTILGLKALRAANSGDGAAMAEMLFSIFDAGLTGDEGEVTRDMVKDGAVIHMSDLSEEQQEGILGKLFGGKTND